MVAEQLGLGGGGRNLVSLSLETQPCHLPAFPQLIVCRALVVWVKAQTDIYLAQLSGRGKWGLGHS